MKNYMTPRYSNLMETKKKTLIGQLVQIVKTDYPESTKYARRMTVRAWLTMCLDGRK